MTEEKTRAFAMTIDIDAPLEDVWKALSDARELVRWFPTDARVRPGAGGSVWVSWNGAWAWEMRIAIWEPGRHLRLLQQQATPFDIDGQPVREASVPPVEVALDFYLEGEGGRTRLRLVHSGFGRGAAWDDEIEGVSRGWGYELRGLRHYLARHKGTDRRVAWARAKTALDVERAWSLVTGPDGLAREGRMADLGEGDRYRILTAEGDLFEGRVLQCQPPWDFSGTVSGLNDSVLRVANERFTGRTASNVWLYGYGLDAVQVDGMQARWQRMLDGLLAGRA